MENTNTSGMNDPVELRNAMGISYAEQNKPDPNKPEARPQTMTDMIAEKGKAGWERDTKKVRNFFGKAASFLYGLGESDVQQAIKKDVQEKYEKRKTSFMDSMKEAGRHAMDALNTMANQGADFINETADMIGREATRARDNLARAVGSDVVAPLINDVLRPVYVNVISVEDDLRRAPGALVDALGTPLERGGNWLVRIVRGNPITDVVQTMAESYKKRGKTKEGFARFILGVNNVIDRTSVALWETRDIGTQLRGAATEIRNAANRNWQERSATYKSMGTAAQQLKNA